MGASDSHDAGLALGVGAPWDKHLGLDGVFEGSIPLANSKVEKATTAFGQGKTSVSPAALAVMAASVARGSYIEPALVKTPAVAGADRAPKPLDAKAASELRTLMRLVVTDGTAKGVFNAVPGGPVSGKTGTAEYGTATPLATHAWFVGWQGNVAFAVLVEDGKSGAAVAGPIAASFLTNLRH
jgi:cell division protein FtsI/penicillin-binding protein 2